MDEKINQALAQIESDLRNINSAREMVDETVNAYKDGAKQIKTYSEQLSQVSEKIGWLIEQIKLNEDTLSSQVDVKINAAISKIEGATSTFGDKTAQQIDGFKGKTDLAVNGLNSAVNGFVGEAKQAINQASEAGKISQKEAKDALDAATTKMESAIKYFNEQNKKLFADFKASVGKKITIVAIILALLIFVNIMIYFI